MKRLMGALCLTAMLAGLFCAGCGASSTRYTAESAVTRQADETGSRGRVAYDAYARSGSARDTGRELTYATGADGSVLPNGSYRYSALTGRIMERNADGNDRNDGGSDETAARQDLMTQTASGA